jgi:hypothetical protein
MIAVAHAVGLGGVCTGCLCRCVQLFSWQATLSLLWPYLHRASS